MKVIEIDANLQEKWDQIANDEKHGSFMQSIVWGEFKKNLGQKVWNLAVVDSDREWIPAGVYPVDSRRSLSRAWIPASAGMTRDGNDMRNESGERILAICQVVKEELVGFGSFLYVPYGPIFKTQNIKEALAKFKEKLIELAKTEQAIFIRLEPKIKLPNETLKFYNTYRQIQHTLKLDLKSSEEELLASFKSKTRYNLRLSQKKGVEIVDGSKGELTEFIDILKIVGKRGDFVLPENKYFFQMYDSLKSKGAMDLLLAKYRGEIVGGFINVYFKDEATYLYGASLDNYRNLMVNYPLMWETIKRAKNHGCSRLDFRGAAPNELDQSHPWYGFTRFKRGFAPHSPIESYPGSYFIIAKPVKFYLYYLSKLIRRRPL